MRLPRLSEASGRPYGAPFEELAAFAPFAGDAGETRAEAVRVAIRDGLSARDAWVARMDADIARADIGGDAPTATAYAALRDRVADALDKAAIALPPAAILVAPDLTPAQFIALRLTPAHGLVLEGGRAAGHVAVLARARGVALVIGVGSVPESAGIARLDGTTGCLVLNAEKDAAVPAQPMPLIAPALPVHTRDGRRIDLLVTVNRTDDLDGFDPAGCAGIGLVRSEFLFDGPLPDEDTQHRLYARLMDWAAGRRVAIRLFDFGGDKPLPGNGRSEERGAALLLARPALLREQVRALVRTASAGPLDVLVPMVTAPGEITAIREIMGAERRALAQAGVPVGPVRLGMMVETPQAARTLSRFPVDLAALGTNDLAALATGTARGARPAADIVAPDVLALVAGAVRAGADMGIAVSLCGDAAGDPHALPRLLGCGVRALSVPRPQLPVVADMVRNWP